jgi:hypothetical protein
MFSVNVRLLSKPLKIGNPQQIVAKATGVFLRREGDTYLNFMQTEAPVGHTGLLSRSHVLRIINQFRAEITNTAHYAGFVHEGTAPHMPPASSGLPYPVRLRIAQHGTRPNPWMARAAAMGSQEIQGSLDQLAAEIAREIM